MGQITVPARGPSRVSLVRAQLLVVALAAFLLVAPDPAYAYCRESTTSGPGGDCSDSSGVPLYWGRSCMAYVFNKQSFSRVSKGETFVRQAFASSYQTWADVQCSSTPSAPFLVAQDSGTTSTSAAEFLYDQPNESIVVFRTGNEWVRLPDHDTLALALTLIWHDKKTGEILDVDMELNGGAGDFTDCSQGCRSRSNIDLQNTVTHEAGHLLGLGHSDVRGATMRPSTGASTETEKRTLEADDRAGYCALDLPEGPCAGASCTCSEAPVYASHRTVSTCSCHVAGRQTPREREAAVALAAGVFAIGGMLARRTTTRRKGRKQPSA